MADSSSRAESFARTVATSHSPPHDISDPRLSLRAAADPSLLPSDGINQADDPNGARSNRTINEFRKREGRTERTSRLRSLFNSIPLPRSNPIASTSVLSSKSRPDEESRREEDRELYARELWHKCSHSTASSPCSSSTTLPSVSTHPSATTTETVEGDIRWEAFEKYAEEKESELFTLFVSLDKDGDMRLRKEDVQEACKRAGVILENETLDEFVRALDKNNDGQIAFEEWRDCFLLLPRTTSMSELFQFWQTHRLYRPSMSQLTQDGDVVVGRGKTGWNKLLGKPAIAVKERVKERHDALEAINLRKSDDRHQERAWAQEIERKRLLEGSKDAKGKGRETFVDDQSMGDGDDAIEFETLEEDDEIEGATAGMFSGAGKFLLAGGLAGAVSRTATAPFDRLKVYLITSPTQPILAPSTCPSSGKTITTRRGAGSLPAAVRAVWKQGGGPKAFWTGNGLNVVKIFPESAIKFLSYESAKRIFAEYVDHVPDQTMISNSSRFMAGGIGGVVSQLVIYPIETLKTRVMSSTGGTLSGNALIGQIASDMWRTGGIRLYFKGLTAGLIGVFPYSAIDMSTFEGIKMAYTKWSGAEPGIPGSLAFGACSGGVGATSVYPLNLIRTRLQAQGTPAHPQRYTGVRDAATRCYRLEGWKGFYKGLTPTLVKVVPAVAISWTVYDSTKKLLLSREEEERDHEED